MALRPLVPQPVVAGPRWLPLAAVLLVWGALFVLGLGARQGPSGELARSLALCGAAFHRLAAVGRGDGLGCAGLGLAAGAGGAGALPGWPGAGQLVGRIDGRRLGVSGDAGLLFGYFFWKLWHWPR